MADKSDDEIDSLEKGSRSQYERLRTLLENLGEDDIVEVEDMQSDDTLADITTVEKYELSDKAANELLRFYISISAEIEMESSLIINADVFNFGLARGKGREGSLDFLKEDLTQSDRENMLYYLGIIDEGLKGELARVRRRRNELAHSSEHNYVDDIDQVLSSIKRAKNAREKLASIGIEIEQGNL